MRKILLIVLLIILVCLIGIIWFSKSKVPSPPVPSLKITPEKKEGILFRLTGKKEFKLGEEVKIQVILDSVEYKVDGVDVVLNFDPQCLKFKEIDYSDSVFKTSPPYSVEQEKGEIRFSVLSLPGESFEGKGKVATISFQPLKKGESEIYFDFQPNSTLDSNIALHGEGKDILEKVENLRILIK